MAVSRTLRPAHFAATAASVCRSAHDTALRMSALLFHVSTLNPFAYLAAFVVLGIAGAVPCWMTAARAARTDPVIALRTE
jgi:arginine exporter protein ArgO